MEHADAANPVSPSPAPRPHRQLADEVALLRKIGAGSFGTVYIANDAFGRLLAVKLFPAGSRVGLCEREALREYCRRSSATYPHLLTILQIASPEDATFCYTMELADNFNSPEEPGSIERYEADTLERRLSCRGALPLEEIIRHTRGIISGLQHLHKHGIVHRDIKPGNLLFVGGNIKIGDISLVAPANSHLMERCGTPGYIPPEEPGLTVESPTPYDADLYAVGKTVFRMMTGRGADTFPSLPREVLRQKRLAPLNSFINRACATRRAWRFKDIDEFSRTFEKLVASPLERSYGKSRFTRWIYRIGPRYVNAAMAALLVAAASGATVWLWQTLQSRRNSRISTVATIAPGISSTLGADAKSIFRDEVCPDGKLPDQEGRRTAAIALPEVLLTDSFEIYFEIDSAAPQIAVQCSLSSASAAPATLLSMELPLSRPSPILTASPAPGGKVQLPAISQWSMRILGLGQRVLWYCNGVLCRQTEYPPGFSGSCTPAVTISTTAPGAARLRRLNIFSASPQQGQECLEMLENEQF